MTEPIAPTTPTSLPILPLKDLVVFPNSVMPLFISRHKDLMALEAGLAVNKTVFLTAQNSPADDHPGTKDIHRVGTAADVIQVLRLPDGSAKVLVEGSWVGRIEAFEKDHEYMRAVVTRVEFTGEKSKELEALKRSILSLFEQYASLSDKLPEDLALSIKSLDDPLQLANAVANYGHFKTLDKQKILETLDIGEKMKILSQMLAADNELLKLENNILNQVKSKIGKSQKEYFLNEQLKVIEKELGLSTEEDVELDELQEKIRKTKMSEPARERAYRELNRLARMAPLSPEATVCRSYIEWLIDLPWNKFTKDQMDIIRAQLILDEDHYGLDKVKERIIEFLSVLKLVDRIRGPILCFVGPPGVGKTSLARSIARSLKRKFVRISLGGMRDEAEIRGHRRTYIGSLPGKIIQYMKKAGSMNPVFLLDEIDKMNSDFRGDPASALLEVLDPEQNVNFNDHYIEVDFDLSNVMFITTANTTSGIPYPLLDRMEIIRVPGYTEMEKRMIALQHLLPKQMKSHGLSRKQVAFTNEAIDTVIRSYTHEAGVRNLERELASLCRKSARAIVTNPEMKLLTITPEKVVQFLGPVRHHDMELHDVKEIGVATGLAWTELGGEILPVETTLMPGKGNLLLTGKLGEVMQESAKAALSYIRTNCEALGVDPEFNTKLDIHVHVPEGAIPKDGPSAGITMTVAILSALTKRPVRRDIAMTGEITLRGKVLKIGGLKEKAVAAHRSHVEAVIIPKDNEPELDELGKEIRSAIKFIPVKTLDEVIKIAFVDQPEAAKPNKDSEPQGTAKKPRARKRDISKSPTTHAPRNTATGN